jgi:deazaflavin-dependent oxidoreductase (nitroreductase family)
MSNTPQTRRPSRIRRFGDRMMMRQLRKGRGPSFITLLTVTGQRTGQARTTPVVPVEADGRTWLVSAFGDVAWVRNTRAAGRLALGRGGDRTTYEAHELPAAEAVPVLRRYLSMPSERFVRSLFDVTARSSDEAIAAEAPRHPVFALTPQT